MPGDPHENIIVRGNEFFDEVTAHPIPTDLEAVKLLSSAPALLGEPEYQTMIKRWIEERLQQETSSER